MNDQGTQDAQTQSGPALTVNVNPPQPVSTIVSYPPGPQPSGIDFGGLLNSLAPGIQQNISDQAGAVARDVATQLHTESLGKIVELGGRITGIEAAVAPKVQAAILDAIPQIKRSILDDVVAVSGAIQHDTTTQRHLALLVVGFLGALALSLFIAYLAGSPQAKGIVGWAAVPGAGGMLLAWAASGLKTPKKG